MHVHGSIDRKGQIWGPMILFTALPNVGEENKLKNR